MEAARALPWADSRLVKAVAKACTLPAAAALGFGYSTAFRRLRAVKALLGMALFERHRSGFPLTPNGEEVAALAAREDEEITNGDWQLVERGAEFARGRIRAQPHTGVWAQSS